MIKSSGKSVCDDCTIKKRCKDCNILKTDFYKYKNNKIYSTCIECFNKKVICEFCRKEFNRTCLSKHIERCLIKTLHLNNNDENIINNKIENNFINNNDENNILNNCNDENTEGALLYNRTLKVGPSFCGKTHLLLNKLQLIRLCDSEKQLKIVTRSPEQYKNLDTEDTSCISVEENLEDRTIQDFQNCCVVFDDMLDSNQKRIHPFFTRGKQ